MADTSGIATNGQIELHWTVASGDSSSHASSPASNHASEHPDRRLLLINGLGSPLVAFESGFVEDLVARGVSVARFDNRDVGRSSRVSGNPGAGAPLYTVSDMAADAVAVLDALGWESAHVLGQSMGGMIAQVMALEHPDRVDSLIALMSASGERGFGLSTDAAKRALLQPAPSDPAAWLEHRLATEQIWASPEHWSPEWVTEKAKAMLDHGVDPKGTARQFRAVMAAGSRDVALGGLSTPTLVIHGSADTLIQPDGGRHLADVIPGATYIEVEGLGHDLPPPFWPKLTTIVTDFIESV